MQGESMIDFSMIFDLFWKIIIQILFNEGVFETLQGLNIDLTKYINVEDFRNQE